MRKTGLFVLALILFVFACTHLPPVITPGIVLYAQSVPAVVTFTWNANPPAENVISYQVAIDGTTKTVLASACTQVAPSVCTTTLTVPAFGAHVATAAGTNLNTSGDPGVTGTPQTGVSASINFSLNPAPGKPTGLGLR